MIIPNVDLYRASIRPTKNYPPLIIDPNAMKALELSLKGFEPVARWGRKVTQRFSIIQQVELPGSYSLDTRPPNTLAESALFEKPFYRWIDEALDGHPLLYHGKVYLRKVFVCQAVKEGRKSA